MTPANHVHHEPGPAGFDQAAGQPARPAGPAPVIAGDSEGVLAAFCYLGVIFFSFLPALAVYLTRGRTSSYLRFHAARAANLAITLLLFNICALIVGGLLALDTVEVGLIIVVPLASALWVVVLGYLIRAALAAERGQQYDLPEWLCARVLKSGS
ncbi:MAG TPA: DUF4870 domain-containing protein [Streptosporangiaceae bacterium]